MLLFPDVAIGQEALYSNLDGSSNISIGNQSFYQNTSGGGNIGLGNGAGYGSGGNYNIALGHKSLGGIKQDISGNPSGTGGKNVAIGFQALNQLTDGSVNIAISQNSLYSNTTGEGNIGIGWDACYYSKSGNYNTTVGISAGKSFEYTVTGGSISNPSGQPCNYNCIFGASAGQFLCGIDTSGSNYNTIMGQNAGNFIGGSYNLFLGNNAGNVGNTGTNYNSLKSGDKNVFIGSNAGYDKNYSGSSIGDYNIYIGADVFGSLGESHTTRIGYTVSGINNYLYLPNELSSVTTSDPSYAPVSVTPNNSDTYFPLYYDPVTGQVKYLLYN